MRISVKVKTRAKEQKIEKVSDNSFNVFVRSAPINNKANIEIIEVLSKYFSVPKSLIRLKLGANFNVKVFDINI